MYATEEQAKEIKDAAAANGLELSPYIIKMLCGNGRIPQETAAPAIIDKLEKDILCVSEAVRLFEQDFDARVQRQVVSHLAGLGLAKDSEANAQEGPTSRLPEGASSKILDARFSAMPTKNRTLNVRRDITVIMIIIVCVLLWAVLFHR